MLRARQALAAALFVSACWQGAEASVRPSFLSSPLSGATPCTPEDAYTRPGRAKSALIREFKERFDFHALQQMLGH